MFKAVLLICLMGKPEGMENCMELHDQWGPYETKELCVKRIYQMGPFVHQYMPGFVPTSYKCIRLVDGRLT